MDKGCKIERKAQYEKQKEKNWEFGTKRNDISTIEVSSLTNDKCSREERVNERVLNTQERQTVDGGNKKPTVEKSESQTDE